MGIRIFKNLILAEWPPMPCKLVLLYYPAIHPKIFIRSRKPRHLSKLLCASKLKVKQMQIQQGKIHQDSLESNPFLNLAQTNLGNLTTLDQLKT